jgi:formylglycine-generating enzyme required for sulfatase activity
VALKVIKIGMDTRDVVARFEAERQALALMDHPHIAKIFDAGATESGRPYFAMESVRGLPITDYCDRNRLDTRARLELFMQVCDAVQHAHHKGIIHRDIKPSNVLVMIQDEKPRPKIIDFGVAKATNQRLTEKTVFTERGQLIGTPEYMSPEQAEMTTLDVDTRTDIYSLGVLLYELLVGSLPFDRKQLYAGGYAEIQRNIRDVEPPLPSKRLSTLGDASKTAAAKRRTDLRVLMRELREDMDWIIMKANEKDRTRRYPTASEFAADIARHLRDEPILAGPPGVLYRMRKLVRKHRRAFVAAALLLGLAGAAVGAVRHARAADFWRYEAMAREAIERADLAEARQRVDFLAKTWRGEPVVEELEGRLSLAEREDRIRRGTEFLAEAEKRRQAFLAANERRVELEEAWQEDLKSVDSWRPAWERDEELTAWRTMLDHERRMEQTGEDYVGVILGYQRALVALPTDCEAYGNARRAVEDFFERSPEHVTKVGARRLNGAFLNVLTGSSAAPAQRGAIAFDVVPRDAEVYCFRYEEYEGRSLPIPYHPERGLVGKPSLVVARADGAGPFQAGDHLLRLEGSELAVPGDLARALAPLREGQSVKVAVLREGKEETPDWTPFPEKTTLPGLPIGLAGYPLDCTEACRVDARSKLELPHGSYLFVFRRHGFCEARYPTTIPASTDVGQIRLVRATDVPAGFVHVPGGRLRTGGDAGAYNGLATGERTIGDLLMSRFEVTFREYVEFLNDVEVFVRTDDKGRAPPTADWDRPAVRPFKPKEGQIQLVPLKENNVILFRRDTENKQWQPRIPDFDPNWPVFGVSLRAAVEYAHWRSLRQEAGRSFRYRLPTEEEWEWAACGATERTFVWGDYPMWPYCVSRKSFKERAAPRPSGWNPNDESPFGVRDLAGSLSEVTTGLAEARLNRYILRGGSWQTSDDVDFRVASRNRRAPEVSHEDTGIRLVVEIDRGAD